MKKVLVVMLALIASIGAITAVANGKPGKKAPKGSLSAELREGLKNKGIFTHLQKLQEIADAMAATAPPVSPATTSRPTTCKKLDRAGWEVSTQEFDFDVFFQDAPTTFEQISPNPRAFVEDEDYATSEFSGSGNMTAELVAIDLVIPPERSRARRTAAASRRLQRHRGQRQDRADAARHLRLPSSRSTTRPPPAPPARSSSTRVSRVAPT